MVCAIPFNADQMPFTDVEIGKWYYEPIYYLYSNNITSGLKDTLFGINHNITRASMVLMLAKIANVDLNNYSYESDFSDVETGKWYTTAVNWACENNLVAGSDGKFMPNAYITKEQTFVILRNFGEYLNYDVTYSDSTQLTLFYDRYSISSYAWTAMCWATNYGLTSGNGDYALQPKKHLTRAEMAAILYKFSWYCDIVPYDPPTVYTVTFKNWDGTVLYSTNTKAGETARYRASTPTRPNSAEYTYSFNGWDKSLSNVQKNTIFTAQFKATYIAVRDIRNDTFGSGITYNGTSFRMSSTLYNKLNTALSNSNDNISFYVVDLQNGATLGYHANRGYWPACTIKAGMALTAYKQAEAGKFSLYDYWTYKSKHYCPLSGTIINSAYGTKFTAKEVLYRMIHISDNAAYYMAQDYVGVGAYNSTVTALGVKNTHNSYNSWGTITAQELGLIWQEIYKYRTKSTYGSQLFSLFQNAEFNFIKTSLKSKYTVAHKSGWNDIKHYVYNDAGIVFAQRPYIVVVLTHYNSSYKGYKSAFSNVVNLLDQYMSEYTQYLNKYNVAR